MHLFNRHFAATAAVVSAVWAAPADAQHDADSRNPFRESGAEKDHLTGDWGGVRTKLFDRGVHLQFGYIGEVFGNVAGGTRRGAVYEGLGEMALELDLEKLVNWRGGTFRASSLWLHGRGPSRLVGDALTVSNIDGHDSIRLYELWLEQKFLREALSIRVGNLLADEEFAGTEYGGLLLNSAFGWPAFISGNVVNTGPAFFVSALGARARFSPSDNWYFQIAAFDGDTFDSAAGNPRVNANGTRWHLSSDQGALVMSELGLRRNNTEEATGLPGTLKLGAWVHTADFTDHARPTKTHRHNVGAYLAAEQMLWREEESNDEQGLGAFFRIGGGPEDRSAFAFTFDTGLHYTGLIPGRDEDKAAIGFVHTDFSDARPGYGVFRNYEQVVEFTYEFAPRPWWTIQPDIQWVHNPSGKRGPDDALVLGLRSSITF